MAKKAAKKKVKTAKKSPKRKATPKKKAGKRTRYSDKRKASLLAKYRQLRKDGATALTAAKKVGVSYMTLLAWEKKAGGPKAAAKKPGRKPVRKPKKTRKAKKTNRSASTSSGITLVTPDGLRIEGISSKELIAVLKALK